MNMDILTGSLTNNSNTYLHTRYISKFTCFVYSSIHLREKQREWEIDVEDLVDVGLEIDCLNQVDLRQHLSGSHTASSTDSNQLRISQTKAAPGETNQQSTACVKKVSTAQCTANIKS